MKHSQRKRIAIFCPSLVSTGGVERAVASLSNMLAEHSDVWAVSLDTPGANRSFDSRSEYVPIGPSLKLPLPLRPISYAMDAYRLWRLKRKLGIQLTISSLWRADLINILSSGRDRKISICQINIEGNETNRLLIRFKRIAALIYKRFDVVVACSTPLREEVRTLFGLEEDKCRVIYNVVPSHTAGIRQARNGRIRMLFCGRFVREKNALALVEIYAQAKAFNPAIQLVMIGDGPLRGDLEKLLQLLGLSTSSDFEDFSRTTRPHARATARRSSQRKA